MACIAVLLLTACHSHTYKIKGSTEGIDDGDTLFATIDFYDGTPFDTAVVKNGKFRFSGRTDSVRQCLIYCADNETVNALLFLEPGEISLKLSIVPEKTRVGGTHINNAWQQLTDSIAYFAEHVNILLAQYYNDDTSSEEKTQLLGKISKHSNRINDCICKVTEENINNELGYYLILDGTMAEKDRMRLIGLMPKEMRDRQEIKDLLDQLATGGDVVDDLKFGAWDRDYDEEDLSDEPF